MALAHTLDGNAWRLFRYEYAAQAGYEPAAHRVMGPLEQYLREHPFTVRRPDGIELLLCIGFVYGLGPDRDESCDGVTADRRCGTVSSREVLALPDGCTVADPLRPGSRSIVLRHPDEEKRQLRAAHRHVCNEPPEDPRMFEPAQDDTMRELTPSEVDDWLEARRLQLADHPRWVVEWQVDVKVPEQ